MKLISQKINQQYYFSVGYDPISKSYMLVQVVTYMGYYDRYFKISKDEYKWFEYDMEKLIALNQECYVQNTRHPKFFFSQYPSENTPKQNEVLKFYMQAEYRRNKKRVLQDRLLNFLREIDKADVTVSRFESACLNQCRIRTENILHKLEDGTLPPSGGREMGTTKHIVWYNSLASIQNLYDAAAAVDMFYSNECKEW